MLDSNFVILGAFINLVGALGYLIATIKGEIKPNKVSFFIWSLAPTIAFAAQLYKGVGIQSLTTFITAFTSIAIFAGSFVNKKAYWKITRFDLVCGALSVMGLLLWTVTREGNLAIFFAILADGLAAIPTIIKSYEYPKTESAFPWLAASTASLLTLFTIQNWSFAVYGFPLYTFLICLVIFILVQFKLKRFFP